MSFSLWFFVNPVFSRTSTSIALSTKKTTNYYSRCTYWLIEAISSRQLPFAKPTPIWVIAETRDQMTSTWYDLSVKLIWFKMARRISLPLQNPVHFEQSLKREYRRDPIFPILLNLSNPTESRSLPKMDLIGVTGAAAAAAAVAPPPKIDAGLAASAAAAGAVAPVISMYFQG